MNWDQLIVCSGAAFGASVFLLISGMLANNDKVVALARYMVVALLVILLVSGAMSTW